MSACDLNAADSNGPISRAIGAVAPVARRTGLSRTDVLSRAARLYPALTELSLWAALRILLSERAALRRFAAAHRAGQSS